MNTELLRKVTKAHTSDGVYDGSMCHEAAYAMNQIKSSIIQFCIHSYAMTDGEMEWPNNKEGDFLKSLYEWSRKD